jgi:hypothetical protein
MDSHKLSFAIGKTKSSKNDAPCDDDIGGSNLVRKPVAEPDEKNLETNPLATKDYSHPIEINAEDNHEEVESTADNTETVSDCSGKNTTFVVMLGWVRKKMVKWTQNSTLVQSPSGQVMTRQYLRKYIVGAIINQSTRADN